MLLRAGNLDKSFLKCRRVQCSAIYCSTVQCHAVQTHFWYHAIQGRNTVVTLPCDVLNMTNVFNSCNMTNDSCNMTHDSSNEINDRADNAATEASEQKVQSNLLGVMHFNDSHGSSGRTACNWLQLKKVTTDCALTVRCFLLPQRRGFQ